MSERRKFRMKDLVAKFDTNKGRKEGHIKKINMKTVLVEVEVPKKEEDEISVIQEKTIIKRHIKKNNVVVKGEA